MTPPRDERGRFAKAPADDEVVLHVNLDLPDPDRMAAHIRDIVRAAPPPPRGVWAVEPEPRVPCPWVIAAAFICALGWLATAVALVVTR